LTMRKEKEGHTIPFQKEKDKLAKTVQLRALVNRKKKKGGRSLHHCRRSPREKDTEFCPTSDMRGCRVAKGGNGRRIGTG